MTRRLNRAYLNAQGDYIPSMHYAITKALIDAPGLSMLTTNALSAIATLALNAITEEVSRPKYYTIESETERGRSYRVSLSDEPGKSTCTCPAFTYRPQFECKHIDTARDRV